MFPHIKEIYKILRAKTISGIPAEREIDELAFSYDAEGDLESITFKEGATVVFTLTFVYDAEKNIQRIVRS